MEKIKILNLHCGIGGNRKGWENIDNIEVTGVDYSQELLEVYSKFFPGDKIICADAKQYLAEHYKEYDFIWASPPCQTHSKMRMMASKRGSYTPKLPNLELYEFIIFLQHYFKGKWVVENVVPYYKPLIEPSGKLGRHLVWSNFNFESIKIIDSDIKHNKVTGKTEKYGISLVGISIKHRKDQIIRNCVNPKIGEHLLNSAFTKENNLK